MKCIVTAGPTYEPLDEVRRLTNFSTGRLGSELADFLVSCGHEVTLFRGEQATWSQPVKAKLVRFTNGSDLSELLRAAALQNFDVVFHAAAVGDFKVNKVWQRLPGGELIPLKHGKKISSRLKDLFVQLSPTPKILTHLRSHFPRALLVGWKFEVDGNRETALEEARQQITECRTNACVVNGPAYGSGFGLLTTDVRHCGTKEELFEQLAAILPKRDR